MWSSLVCLILDGWFASVPSLLPRALGGVPAQERAAVFPRSRFDLLGGFGWDFKVTSGPHPEAAPLHREVPELPDPSAIQRFARGWRISGGAEANVVGEGEILFKFQFLSSVLNQLLLNWQFIDSCCS